MSNYEAEILEKIIIYSRDTGTAACGGAGVNQWIVEKLKEDGYQASLCKTSWLTTISSSSQGSTVYPTLLILRPLPLPLPRT